MISYQDCTFDKTGTMLFRLIGPGPDDFRPQCLKCGRLPGEDCNGYKAGDRATKCYRMREQFKLVPIAAPSVETRPRSAEPLVIDAEPTAPEPAPREGHLIGNAARPTTAVEARTMGFTGNPCTRCGSIATVRNGTCVLCTDCGETTGCS